MTKNIKDELWYNNPFGWYEQKSKPELYGVQITEVVALDFLQGLYDIYVSLKKNNNEKAARDAEILATLLIASTLNYGEEVIAELVAEEFNDLDVDEEVKQLVKELQDED